jgi:hypothetical protein
MVVCSISRRSLALEDLNGVVDVLLAVGTVGPGQQFEAGLADCVVQAGLEDDVAHILVAHNAIAVLPLVVASGLVLLCIPVAQPPLPEVLVQLAHDLDARDQQQTAQQEGDQHQPLLVLQDLGVDVAPLLGNILRLFAD